MHGKPVRIFNRYSGEFEEEKIYGEAALRFAYETPMGRWLTACFFSRPYLSKCFGWYMKRPASARRIVPFVRKYGLDATEFTRPLGDYRTFNDFFCRQLRPEYRPIDPDPRAVIFPADGRHLGWQAIGSEESVFVKGQRWNLDALLDQDRELSKGFEGGSLVLSRLCPTDYHHFHFPVDGHLTESRWMDERLFSVSPLALRYKLAFLWRNRRCLNVIDTEHLGQVCLVEIGATHVGSIKHREMPPGRRVRKGQAKGWFEFGGSSLVTLFEPGRISLSEDLTRSTRQGVELYAHFGDRMAVF